MSDFLSGLAMGAAQEIGEYNKRKLKDLEEDKKLLQKFYMEAGANESYPMQVRQALLQRVIDIAGLKPGQPIPSQLTKFNPAEVLRGQQGQGQGQGGLGTSPGPGQGPAQPGMGQGQGPMGGLPAPPSQQMTPPPMPPAPMPGPGPPPMDPMAVPNQIPPPPGMTPSPVPVQAANQGGSLPETPFPATGAVPSNPPGPLGPPPFAVNQLPGLEHLTPTGLDPSTASYDPLALKALQEMHRAEIESNIEYAKLQRRVAARVKAGESEREAWTAELNQGRTGGRQYRKHYMQAQFPDGRRFYIEDDGYTMKNMDTGEQLQPGDLRGATFRDLDERQEVLPDGSLGTSLWIGNTRVKNSTVSRGIAPVVVNSPGGESGIMYPGRASGSRSPSVGGSSVNDSSKERTPAGFVFSIWGPEYYESAAKEHYQDIRDVYGMDIMGGINDFTKNPRLRLALMKEAVGREDVLLRDEYQAEYSAAQDALNKIKTIKAEFSKMRSPADIHTNLKVAAAVQALASYFAKGGLGRDSGMLSDKDTERAIKLLPGNPIANAFWSAVDPELLSEKMELAIDMIEEGQRNIVERTLSPVTRSDVGLGKGQQKATHVIKDGKLVPIEGQ